MILALIWLPWSWKGEISRWLASQHWFAVFTPGVIFRQMAKQDPELHQILAEGKLVPPPVARKALKQFLTSHQGKKIVLDGYPRDLQQKQFLDDLAPQRLGVRLRISPEVAIQRTVTAMHNPRTWQRFPSHFTHDPQTWEKLEKRADDNLPAVKKRIKTFQDQTMPMLKELAKSQKLIVIDATKPLEQVKQDFLNLINHLKQKWSSSSPTKKSKKELKS